MRRGGRRLAWALLMLWCTWIFALTGYLGAVTSFGPWLPDLGLVLLFALGLHVRPGQLLFVALVIALARCASSIEPPAAVLAAYLGLAGFHGMLRSLVNLEEPLVRFAVTGASAFGLAAWLSVVHDLRHPILLEGGPELAWRAALATAIGALLASGFLLRLPGLRPLWERRQLL